MKGASWEKIIDAPKFGSAPSLSNILTMLFRLSFYLEVALPLLGWEYALSGHGLTIKGFLLCKECRKNLVPGVGGSFRSRAHPQREHEAEMLACFRLAVSTCA